VRLKLRQLLIACQPDDALRGDNEPIALKVALDLRAVAHSVDVPPTFAAASRSPARFAPLQRQLHPEHHGVAEIAVVEARGSSPTVMSGSGFAPAVRSRFYLCGGDSIGLASRLCSSVARFGASPERSWTIGRASSASPASEQRIQRPADRAGSGAAELGATPTLPLRGNRFVLRCKPRA